MTVNAVFDEQGTDAGFKELCVSKIYRLCGHWREAEDEKGQETPEMHGKKTLWNAESYRPPPSDGGCRA